MPFSFMIKNTPVRTVQNSKTSSAILNPKTNKQKSELEGQEKRTLIKVQARGKLKQRAMPVTLCAVQRQVISLVCANCSL